MNAKAKGARCERKAIKLLEACGFFCIRSAASLGAFDLVAFSPNEIKLVQVKAGGRYLSAVEREAIAGLALPPNVSREVWRFPDYARAPIVERL